MTAALFYAQVLRLLLAMMSVPGPAALADSRLAIAESIVRAGATEREQEWLAAVAYRESGFRVDALGDHGGSFSAFQIHLPHGARTAEGWTGPELCADPYRAAVVALRMMRQSFSACAWLPEGERLAAYARGSCNSPQGQRLSRDRDAVRRRMFGGAR